MEKNIPPPPYSETDALSNPESTPRLTPATSHTDNLSTVSSTEGVANPIFTPTGSVHPDETLEDAAPSSAPAPATGFPTRAATSSSHGGADHDGSTRSYSGGFMQANSNGFRLGPLVADSQGFRIGNLFVADCNGVKIGGNSGFVASGAGVSLGGRALSGQQAQSSNVRGRQHQYGHDHGREKGRARSASSSSSLSSESSRSDASIESLPDYDDLKPQQLPIARESLLKWLDHPEQPVTQEGVQSLRQQLKVAGKSGNELQEKEAKEMRAEVKDLMKRFKELKKIQKKQRKSERRERRAAGKAARKAHRHVRKEERKLRKSQRKSHGMQESSGAAQDADHLRNKANTLDTVAGNKEHCAASLRTAMANPTSGDKARAVIQRKATRHEEEAAEFRLEAVRLRAEALHLEGKEAETGQQASGVVLARDQAE